MCRIYNKDLFKRPKTFVLIAVMIILLACPLFASEDDGGLSPIIKNIPIIIAILLYLFTRRKKQPKPGQPDKRIQKTTDTHMNIPKAPDQHYKRKYKPIEPK